MTVGSMLRVLLFSLALLSITGEALAVTVSWDCNPEADMKEYRVEYSADAGASWGVEGTIPHLKPCTSPVSMGVTRYLKPGSKLYRVFAIDTTGNVSGPSATAPYTVTVPPIGNPGGQEEAPIPPSPYNATPTPPPPPPVAVKPGPIQSMVESSLEPKSAVITVSGPEGAKIDVRFAKTPMSWGSAAHAICNDAGRCELLDLQPGMDYDYQAVAYFGVMNQGAIYGPLSDIKTFTTAPLPAPPPPPAPGPPPPLGLKEALQSGLDTCLTKKLAHTACMKALSEALGKVNS